MKEELYKSVANDSDTSYKLSIFKLKNGMEIPQELIESISQDIINAQWFSQQWIKTKNENPPQILIETILKSDDYLHIFRLFSSFVNEWKLSNDEEKFHTIPNKKIIYKCMEMLEKLLDKSM